MHLVKAAIFGTAGKPEGCEQRPLQQGMLSWKLLSWKLCLSPTPPSHNPVPLRKTTKKSRRLSPLHPTPVPEVHECAYRIFKFWVCKLWSLDLLCDFPPPSPPYFWETGKVTQEHLVH